MTARILIIGGYGNFGSVIARRLAADPAIALIIAGRSADKAQRMADSLGAANAPQAVHFDILGDDLGARLAAIDPQIVIHTSGPFQGQDYRVAEACIAQARHYIDLADARGFVAGIDGLNAAAMAAGVLVVGGASSVPALTAAVIDHYRPQFSVLDRADYGIAAAQQTNRGLATMAAILSYVGRPFEGLRDGRATTLYGWHGARSHRYPQIGRRWLGDCDIPDLELFPARYPGLTDIRFGAGHELPIVHFGAWAMGWVVRTRLLRSLDPMAPWLLRAAQLFDPFGSSDSGFHMVLRGRGPDDAPLTRQLHLIARSGDGPNIPCIPAILLAQRLARGDEPARGARPCLDLIALRDYVNGLADLDISLMMDPPDAVAAPPAA